MPVPATKGQLRTRIEDMQVGDYIICEYQASSGSVGLFRNLGTSTAAEIPVTGEAAPNGSFYLVMVDKKPGYGWLLIADRVIQHSISWNILNSNKFIQGTGCLNNIIPTMTSDTTPYGVASASSVYSSYYSAYTAFDGIDDLRGWAAPQGVKSGWLSYEFTSPKTIRAYSIKPRNYSVADAWDGKKQAPNTWTFEGWDGISWVVLDTQTNITWPDYNKKIFVISNKTPYIKYRINVTSFNGGYNICIGEMEMSEDPNILTIRSLTGGVAHADANGNSSLTNQNRGGWPLNNEWDKYIVNFPQDLIQSGKTLDDIFHLVRTGAGTVPYTWCQETPINGVLNVNAVAATNLRRTCRVMWSNNILSHSLANDNGDYMGFRPVLEYKEV